MQNTRPEIQNLMPVNTAFMDADGVADLENVNAFMAFMRRDAKQLTSQLSHVGNNNSYFDVRSPLPSNRLEEHVLPYTRDKNFKFSIAFPDGTKAHVSGENSPHMMSIKVNTDSRKLAENLRANKLKTERSLSSKMRKKVTLHIG